MAGYKTNQHTFKKTEIMQSMLSNLNKIKWYVIEKFQKFTNIWKLISSFLNSQYVKEKNNNKKIKALR